MARSITITSKVEKFLSKFLKRFREPPQEKEKASKRIKSPMNSSDQIKFMFDLEEDRGRDEDKNKEKD